MMDAASILAVTGNFSQAAVYTLGLPIGIGAGAVVWGFLQRRPLRTPRSQAPLFPLSGTPQRLYDLEVSAAARSNQHGVPGRTGAGVAGSSEAGGTGQGGVGAAAEAVPGASGPARVGSTGTGVGGRGPVGQNRPAGPESPDGPGAG